MAEIAAFLRNNLPLAPVPFVPEIRLHKAGPASRLRDLEIEGAPYWAHYWAGGLALARYVLDQPNAVCGRRVVDLGAGSGIVGIAAAVAGAASVRAIDVDSHAVVALACNAAANGVVIDVARGDGTCDPLIDVDVLLVGDLFYDGDIAAKVIAFAQRATAAGVDVLIGDPDRAFLPRDRLEILAEYRVSETGAHGMDQIARAYRFVG